MSCCAAGTEASIEMDRAAAAGPSREEIALATRDLGDGLRQSDLTVPAVHCGACIHAVETALKTLGAVEEARVNLSTRRVSVRWRGENVPPIAETLAAIGYPAHLTEDAAGNGRREFGELIRAVAVAGFAAANIMLLSVSVWSGATGATRDLFHWISALIAVPALAYSGRIFFRSAFAALRAGRLNMDVPIVIGVSLAYAMSLYETIRHDEHAYFDAAVTLLFFLLIGRTLDHVMREKARTAVAGLARLAARGAVVLEADGTRTYRPLAEIARGMTVLIAAGDRVPVDACVTSGLSEVDCALVTGESAPQRAGAGTRLVAGTMNLTGPLTATVLEPADRSFLAEMMRLMEAAEGGRAGYRRLADRASALYAPVVHIAAAASFLGWLAATGDWHRALTIAIAVLIITCPCALGLAVPIVQVMAARRLFERGIMVKDGSALERLAEADRAVFDKTGTLTAAVPALARNGEIDPEIMAVAGALASRSSHPYSRAIAAAAPPGNVEAGEIREVPGSGIEGRIGDHLWRLGRADWAAPVSDLASGSTVLSRNGVEIARFRFEDRLRPDARQAVTALAQAGFQPEILSGDAPENVAAVAASLDIARFAGGLRPEEKLARLAEIEATGAKAVMIGDGLNDAPALAAAHVSMAPATAADIGRNAADFVFLRDSLTAVPDALAVARRARILIRQNFALAIGYNLLAVPFAILGHVTPLWAAVAMSTSSLVVIANALRLKAPKTADEHAATSQPAEIPPVPGGSLAAA